VIALRYGFWIKAMKGEEQSRYFCADKQDHVMKIMAAIIKAKVCQCTLTTGWIF